MTDFMRFPHTPHLAWLGAGAPRSDKVLSRQEADEFLSEEVVVEEKVDGANLGFSIDAQANLRAQNRGSYLDLTALRGQWKPLRAWLGLHRAALEEALFPDLMLFGEWCFAMHGLAYTALPDWLLVFDVCDRARGEFWDSARRDALAARIGLVTVPCLGKGKFDVPALKRLLERSRLTEGPAEGLYVRRENGGRLVARAKLVRPEFVQAIEEHWSKRAIVPNRLAGK